MSFIAFLGCDGSGKSAVIDGVARRLESDGVRVTRGHWCPKPFATPNAQRAAAADNPHGQRPRGMAGSVFKLSWLWFNWWAAWLLCLRGDSRRGVVLFDRYHADLLVDPQRYRYGGPAVLARFASRGMPQPDAVIFLDAPPAVLLSRKQEVAADALQRSCDRYLELCQTHRRFHRVDAARPLEEVLAEATALVRAAG